MSRCRKCGKDADYRRLCYACRTEWMAQRMVAYRQALDENGGTLTAANLKAVQKRAKQLERQASQAT